MDDSKEIISLTAGIARIDREGIEPFIKLVEGFEIEDERLKEKEKEKEKGKEKGSGEVFFDPKQFVKLYDLIFKMCIQPEGYNWSKEVYEHYESSIIKYVNKYVGKRMRSVLNTENMVKDIAVLKEWVRCWKNYKLIVRGLSKLFMYLDRFYTPNTDNVYKLKELAYKQYYNIIFKIYLNDIKATILRCIERERQGEEQDRTLLQQSINIYIEMSQELPDKKNLKIYKEEFEYEMIQETAIFYKQRSLGWLASDSCSSYLERVDAVFIAERQRVDSYLHRGSLDLLFCECYRQLLQIHQIPLLKKQTGFAWLLSNHALPELARIYRLYNYGERYATNNATDDITTAVTTTTNNNNTNNNNIRAGADSNCDMVLLTDIFYEHVVHVGQELIERCVNVSAQTQDNGDKDDKENKQDNQADKQEDNQEKENESKEPNKKKRKCELTVGNDQNHTLVNTLLDLHARCTLIITECFANAHSFQYALKRSFESFINKYSQIPKQLAKFTATLLVKGSKIGFTNLDTLLDNVVFIYGYIQEKDVFEHDYQRFLADRLLTGLCESEHAEKAMISKLKKQCGYHWTNKLEGMFKDVILSKELMSRYSKVDFRTDNNNNNEEKKKMKIEDITLEVHVCTTGYWPSSRAVGYKIPEELRVCADRYRRFYLGQNSGHKLEWRMDLGQAELVVDFSSQMRRSLVVNTPQMMLLLAFNSQKILSYQQLLDITGLSRIDADNSILSLAHPKIAILLKRPNTKILELSHQFMVNNKYTSQLRKVVVPLLQSTVKDPQEDKSAALIELQRRHMIDACVVRIMKARKKLRFNILVSETITYLQARFPPQPHDIKKRIEALVESEYLKRSDEDRNIFEYLA